MPIASIPSSRLAPAVARPGAHRSPTAPDPHTDGLNLEVLQKTASPSHGPDPRPEDAIDCGTAVCAGIPTRSSRSNTQSSLVCFLCAVKATVLAILAWLLDSSDPYLTSAHPKLSPAD